MRNWWLSVKGNSKKWRNSKDKPNLHGSGFPDSSIGKESARNTGDLGSIPGLGRSPGEGNSYPLQYSGLDNSMDCIGRGVAKSRTWLSNFHFHFHVGQTVKNLPVIQETPLRSLGWDSPLENGMGIHSSIFAWKIPWTEEPVGLQFMGSQRVGHNWACTYVLTCTRARTHTHTHSISSITVLRL